MKKDELIKLLESKKPKNLKISGQMTKEQFINILESGYKGSVLDTYEQMEKGGVAELDVKKTPNKVDAGLISKLKPKEPEKLNLKYANDLGIKAIVFDEKFKNIDDSQKIGLSDMFSTDEIDKILATKLNEWPEVVPKLTIYCRESDLEGSRESIKCFDAPSDSQDKDPAKTLKNAPFVKTLYTRLDDDKKLLDVRYPNKKGQTVTVRYIPMGVAPTYRAVEMAMLPLTQGKFAVVIRVRKKDDAYLFPLASKEAKMLFLKK